MQLNFIFFFKHSTTEEDQLYNQMLGGFCGLNAEFDGTACVCSDGWTTAKDSAVCNVAIGEPMFFFIYEIISNHTKSVN